MRENLRGETVLTKDDVKEISVGIGVLLAISFLFGLSTGLYI